MRIYLDNCCFNRPFDNQSSIRVKLETDAKLYVQLLVKIGRLELAWSYILDFENSANPFIEKKSTIEKWKPLSIIDVAENDNILNNANSFVNLGVSAKDALHVACAIDAKCGYFLTTDDTLLKKISDRNEITVLNPTDFIKIVG
jgi:hypothetical protein